MKKVQEIGDDGHKFNSNSTFASPKQDSFALRTTKKCKSKHSFEMTAN